MRTIGTALVLLTSSLMITDLSAQVVEPGRSTVYAPRGAVATSQPLATSAALRVLEEGGNAFDAAVVAAAVLNVTEPHMTGMGGDMFALFWSADEGGLGGLDASGKGGSLLDADALVAAGHERMPGSGPMSVTVPGAVSGWAALLERYGTLTLAEALAPAIRIASEGFPVTPIIARQWQGQTEKLKRNPGSAATYLINGERAPEAGEWMTNVDLARTFERIAAEGQEVLYGGALGREIAEGVQELGGFLTPEDFASHAPRWVDPISIPFRDYTIWELPPAGQGVAALQMLGIVDPMDLEGMGFGSADYLHLMIETKKLAYEDLRRYVADPDYMTTSVEELLSDDYLAERRRLVDPRLATDREEADQAAQASETIYLSTADQHGNMVSFINSVYGYFGSGRGGPRDGRHAAEPGRWLHPRGRTSQPRRGGQAAVPHDHPGLRDQG